MIITVVVIAAVALLIVVVIAILIVRGKGKKNIVSVDTAKQKTSEDKPAHGRHTSVNTTERTMNTIIMDEEDDDGFT